MHLQLVAVVTTLYFLPLHQLAAAAAVRMLQELQQAVSQVAPVAGAQSVVRQLRAVLALQIKVLAVAMVL